MNSERDDGSLLRRNMREKGRAGSDGKEEEAGA